MEFVKPLKIGTNPRTTKLRSLIHPVRHNCLCLRALLNNKRLVHAIAALASAFVFCSNAIAQPASKESFYRITFDDTPVGFEYVRIDEIEGTQPRAMACYRRTQLNLKRMGQDLTLRASLWTEQTSSGQLLNFTLQRQSGSGSLLERSGEFIAQTGAYQIREIQSGTRREYELRSEGILYSPIFSSWLPERALSTNGRSMTPVLFPETAGISNPEALVAPLLSASLDNALRNGDTWLPRSRSNYLILNFYYVNVNLSTRNLSTRRLLLH